MKLTRREFIKTSAIVGGFAAMSDLVLGGPLSTFVKTKSEYNLSAADAEEWKPTTCWIGKQDCGMLARIVDGRVVKLEGHPDHPRNKGTLCPKGVAQLMAIYDPYRVKAPLKRTNEKGVPGEWVEVSWDEALTEVGDKIKEVREKDKRLLIWQKGRSKAEQFYDEAFIEASGATKLHHGAFCSDAGYRACEYTIGQKAVLSPDFKHCNYMLNWGWNITGAGGNMFCWITYNQQFLDARERGMKVVTLDPSLRAAAHHTDEWLPIMPSTDLAFFLAIANVLVANNYIDEKYLKNYTNAPFLVKGDGYFLRIDEKEQVWDMKTNSAQPFDALDLDPALEGGYTAGGNVVKPAFQLFKEHVAQYTPQQVATITGLSAEQIEGVALELGKNAKIGSTVVIDGVEIPYRPVGIMAYHVSQQELGFQAIRAALSVFMLLGAIEAVGGVRSSFGRSVHGNFKSLNEIKIKDPPYNIYLKDSAYFPINSNNSSIVAHVMLDPEKYGVDYTPEVLILHMSNPLLAYPASDIIYKAYKKFKFVAVIDPWLSETADYFADIVLPAATIEKYEGPIGITDHYEDGVTLRLPPIDPLYSTKGDIDIYIDLCEKADILYGEEGYIAKLEHVLKLKEEFMLDLETKPTVRDIFDKWAKSSDIAEGIEYFEKNGVKLKGNIPANKLYASAWSPPYGGIRHRLYGESLKTYQDEMKAKGTDEIYYQDYTPFPTWRVPTFNKSPADYEFYLISFKKIEFKQSRSTHVPLLNELEPQQGLEINSKTAAEMGLGDGDEAWVESHNAITGETKKIKTNVKVSELIRPDTVAMFHHYGHWVHPVSKNDGPTPNSLFFTGEGYVTNTADQSFQVKVKVWKAE